ncbi:MAG: hypothetical protein JW924_04930 [Fusobacteriaceae bacterium]|nr:hypothetical protein [Fusobacteriaceae bacterium]
MIENDFFNIWNNVREKIENKEIECSSEKTVVFYFAWFVKEKYKNSKINFEKSIFNNFSDGKFLDLYIEIDCIRIGIEFKFLKKGSKHNTNQTESRIKIINDIKRISWLKEKNYIDYGYFFCITNENPYITEGRKKKSVDFKTYHKIKYIKDTVFPIDNEKSKETVKVLRDIEIIWENINSKLKILQKSQYAYLKISV